MPARPGMMFDPAGRVRELAKEIAAHEEGWLSFQAEISDAVDRLVRDLGIMGIPRGLTLPQRVDSIRKTMNEYFAADAEARRRASAKRG